MIIGVVGGSARKIFVLIEKLLLEALEGGPTLI